MGKLHEIASTSLETVELMQWSGQPMHQYTRKLNSFLALKLDKTYSDLLAIPKLAFTPDGKKVISWQVTDFQDIVRPLSETPIEEQEAAKRKLAAVQSLASELASATSAEERQWGELFQAVLSGLSDEQIFYDGERLAVVNWGVKERTASTNQPLAKEKSLAPPLTSTREKLPPQSPKVEEVTDEASPARQETEVIPTAPTAADDPTRQNKQDYNQANEGDSKTTEEHSDSAQERGSNDGEKPPTGKGPIRWSPGGYKSWWWILLILLLIGLLIWRQCGSTSPSTYLPEQPNVIIPIDTTKIVPDQDSVRSIVSDRINIVIKTRSSTLEDLAEAFKAVYPDAAYQVIYYDTLTRRLQLQVPADERESIMRALPEQLPQFELLIWHESVFKREAYPDDPGFSDRSKSWYFEPIGVSSAWERSFGDPSIIIAVIDDGFDLSHPELAGKALNPWNVLNRSPNVFTRPQALHGTHVAGTALGSRNNGAGLAGIAPDCMLMPIQVADQNGTISSTGVVDAILYAINQGADVINLSLGLQIDPRVVNFAPHVQRDIIANYFLGEEAFWDDLFGIAEDNGVTVILAGGNSNLLVGLDPMQRSQLTLKVSAVGPNLRKASFSNYGAYATLSAPGVGIYSSIPGRAYSKMDGTSMAAPIVAGAAALLKSVNPDLTPRDIRQILVNTGKPVPGDIGPLIQLGAAMEAAAEGRIPESQKEECQSVQSKIDSLLQEIERLRQLCPDTEADTMKMPEVIEDLDFSIGRWKSTTQILNDSKDQVTIYFDFYAGQTGRITLVEPSGLSCTADLSLQARANRFEVDQPELAECSPGPKMYSNYTFSCRADANGYAVCTAQNKTLGSNQFDFKLVKIQ